LPIIAIRRFIGFFSVLPVGKGSFGHVYLCTRKADGARLVMKIIDVTAMNEAERAASAQEVAVLRQFQVKFFSIPCTPECVSWLIPLTLLSF
jgi:hypothetical protein